jgi:anthranilate phosphoribosyltransferase
MPSTRLSARSHLESILAAPPTPSGDATIRDFLLAGNQQAFTPDQLAGYTDALRQASIPLPLTTGERAAIVDTCGTGGDLAATFNISTAAAILAAACDVPIAKHGNRASTSRCGSADVLEALGIPLQTSPDSAAASLREHNFAFLFAPAFHPALARVAPIRRALGVRTFFNLIGPLSNPAGARRQLIGVYDPALVPLLAQTLALLGVDHALVVHGFPAQDSPESTGLDEITLAGSTLVAEILGTQILEFTITPAAFDLAPHNAPHPYAASHSPQTAAPGNLVNDNARILTAILANQLHGPPREIVLANTAAVLRVAGRATSWKQGFDLAADAISSGAARRKLEQLSVLR